MLPGIFIILLFYAAGEFIGTLTGGLIPGSVIGMILLFAALCGKVVKPENSQTGRPGSSTDNMGRLFFCRPVWASSMQWTSFRNPGRRY